MKNQTNKGRPAALPSGLVAVDKGGVMREVLVGVLNGTRMPAHGFDVRGFAPNHYRVVNYGPFGVIIGSRVPLEVRVLVDGEQVMETKFIPSKIPLMSGMDPTLALAMAETPQPFMILQDQKGEPLMFKPHAAGLSADDIVANQIHAERMTPPTLDKIDHGVPVTPELKVDLDLAALGILPPAPPAQTPDNANAALTSPATTDGDATLANDVQNAPPQGKVNLPPDVPAFSEVYRDGDSHAEVPSAPVDHQLVDTTERSKTWAPSHGLIAIGVRVIQETPENEPPTPPDAFEYVMFQMNTFDLHVKAMAALQGRVVVPSKETLKRIMAEEGHDHGVGSTREVNCGGISCDHRNHRR